MKRKLMSMLLVLTMALTLLPVSAFAEEATIDYGFLTEALVTDVVKAPLVDNDGRTPLYSAYTLNVDKQNISQDDNGVITVPVKVTAENLVYHTATEQGSTAPGSQKQPSAYMMGIGLSKNFDGGITMKNAVGWGTPDSLTYASADDVKDSEFDYPEDSSSSKKYYSFYFISEDGSGFAKTDGTNGHAYVAAKFAKTNEEGTEETKEVIYALDFTGTTLRQYTVTYNAGLGGTGDPVTKETLYAKKYKLLENMFSPGQAGYEFNQWEYQVGKKGTPTSAAAGTEITISDDTTVTATWKTAAPHVINTSASGGTIEVTGDTVAENDSGKTVANGNSVVTVTATPTDTEANEVKSITVTKTVNGQSVEVAKTETSSSLEFTMPSSDVTVTATFGKKAVKVSSVTFDKNKDTIILDGTTFTKTLTAVVAPEHPDVPTLEWTSSDVKVATVNASGEVTAVGLGKTTITAASTDGSNKSAICEITVMGNLPDATVTFTPEGPYTYNGNAYTPVPKVAFGEVVVAEENYTVAYSNNTNAGEATVSINSAGATGGYCISSQDVNFTIDPAEQELAVTSAKTIGKNSSVCLDGYVKSNVAGATITYAVKENTTLPTGAEWDEATKTLTSKEGTGKAYIHYTVTAPNYAPAEGDIEVTISVKPVVYDTMTVNLDDWFYGAAPSTLTASVNNQAVTPGSCVYSTEGAPAATTEAGTYNVIVTYEGQDTIYETTKTFHILPLEIDNPDHITVTATSSTGMYNPDPETPMTCAVTVAPKAADSEANPVCGTDYTVECVDAAGTKEGIEIAADGTITVTNAGTYTVTVSPAANSKNYTCTTPVTKEFIIRPLGTYISVAPIGQVNYTGSEVKPEVTVTYGDSNAPLDAKEYKVTYEHNIEVSTEATATVSKADNGNFSFDPVTVKFEIVKNDNIQLTLEKTIDTTSPQDIDLAEKIGADATLVTDGVTTSGVIESVEFNGTVATITLTSDAAEDATGTFTVGFSSSIAANGTLTVTVTIGSGDEPAPAPTYAVTVKNGTATINGAKVEKAEENAIVTITASVPAGNTFTNWTSDDVTPKDPSSPTTTFQMPASAVTITANYKENASGDDDNKPTPVPVTGVTLSAETLSLTVGETGALTATVAPSDADDKSVTWSSSDETIATVDTDGKVTAAAAGTATITVTTTDGGKTASCVVTVTAKDEVKTETVAAQPDVAVDPALKEHEAVLTQAANSVAAEDPAPVAEAANTVAQAELKDLNREEAAKNLSDLTGITGTVDEGDVTPVTVTYMKVEVTGYKPDEGAKGLVMNITPMVEVVLTTKAVAKEAAEKKDQSVIKAGENAIQLQKKELTINKAVTISVELPTAFMEAAKGSPIFAIHDKTQTYPCTRGNGNKVSFINRRGFSPFEFTTESNSKVWIGTGDDKVGYADLDAALKDVQANDVITVTSSEIKTGTVTRDDLNGVKFTIKNEDGSAWSGTVTVNGDPQTVDKTTGLVIVTTTKPVEPSKPGSSGSGSGSGGGTGVWGGTASSTPRVSVNSGSHGKVTTSSATPKKGDIVTLTITPDSGYELDTLSVTSGGQELDVDIDGNQATFEMPGASVNVKATFRAVGSEPGSGDEPSTTKLPFADVADDFWAHDEIAWAYDNGYMNGYSATSFNPSGTVTRQQLWMVLARISGENPSDMAAARDWAMRTNVSDGSDPGKPISRQQMVTILYRYAQLNNYNTDGGAALDTYPDANILQNYAKDSMPWAVGNGIVNGTADGRLDPEGTAIRSQFAVILYRFCDTIVK